MSKKKIIIIVLSILLIVAIIISIIYKNKNTQNTVSKVLENTIVDTNLITETITERMLQVVELQKENNDIVGWLEIPNTSISYPVLQGKDNDYYLTHTYKNDYSKDGSIFLDKDYDFSIPSTNLLIYGHNNKNGKMFEELISYKDENFYKNHSKIRYTTADEDSEYEIIAVFKSRVYYQDETDVFRYYYFINASNEDEFDYYINECKKASLYNIDESAEYGDQLMTLSTCDYSRKNGRFVVVAKKISN